MIVFTFFKTASLVYFPPDIFNFIGFNAKLFLIVNFFSFFKCFMEYLSAPLRSNGGRLCFTAGLFLFIFIHRSFSETTQPIFAKFSGIVYSGVVWIIR